MTPTPAWLLFVANYLERIFWTFVQAFIAFALAQDVLDITLASAAAMAGAAACLTVVLATLTDWVVPTDLPFGVLALLRVVRTLGVTTLTLLLSAPELDLSANGWKIALIGALPAVLATIKALAASRLGSSQSPATLPSGIDALSGYTPPGLTFAA